MHGRGEGNSSWTGVGFLPYNVLRDFMSLMNSRDILPLGISPRPLHLGYYDYVDSVKT